MKAIYVRYVCQRGGLGQGYISLWEAVQMSDSDRRGDMCLLSVREDTHSLSLNAEGYLPDGTVNMSWFLCV